MDAWSGFKDGNVIGQRYRIDACEPTDGVLVAYRAYDQQLDRPVIVRHLSEHMMGVADACDHFIHAVQVQSRLRDACLAQVYDYIASATDQAADSADPWVGVPCVVAEPVEVEHQSWRSLLAQQPSLTTPAAVLTVMARIAHTLALTEAQGLIHYAFCPDHVRVTSNITDLAFASIKITGWEIPYLVNEPPWHYWTGAHAYAAPEYVRARMLDVRGLIFAFGALCYESLTGLQPYAAESVEATLRLLSQPDAPAIRPPRHYQPAVPESINAAIMRCLAWQPEHRPQHLAEIAQVLEAGLTLTDPRPPPPHVVPQRPDDVPLSPTPDQEIDGSAPVRAPKFEIASGRDLMLTPGEHGQFIVRMSNPNAMPLSLRLYVQAVTPSMNSMNLNIESWVQNMQRVLVLQPYEQARLVGFGVCVPANPDIHPEEYAVTIGLVAAPSGPQFEGTKVRADAIWTVQAMARPMLVADATRIIYRLDETIRVKLMNQGNAASSYLVQAETVQADIAEGAEMSQPRSKAMVCTLRGQKQRGKRIEIALAADSSTALALKLRIREEVHIGVQTTLVRITATGKAGTPAEGKSDQVELEVQQIGGLPSSVASTLPKVLLALAALLVVGSLLIGALTPGHPIHAMFVALGSWLGPAAAAPTATFTPTPTATLSPTPTPVPTQTPTAVTLAAITMFTNPDFRGPTQQLPAGTTVIVQGRLVDSRFVRVMLAQDGQVGWLVVDDAKVHLNVSLSQLPEIARATDQAAAETNQPIVLPTPAAAT